jgi:hypothetical protein
VQPGHWMDGYKICDSFCEALKIIFIEAEVSNEGKNDGMYENVFSWNTNINVATT